MRVSLPITIASCVAVVLLTWWLSTRSRDFLTPPDAARLAEVRQHAAGENPTPEGAGDALSPADPRKASSGPVPVVLPRHIESKPEIDDFTEEARHGAGYLVGLARLLDTNGHPDRSLLCWERVLDSSKAAEPDRQRALQQIKRLRSREPEWFSNPGQTLPIVIRAGTGPAAAARLRPVLDAWSESIHSLSGGILRARAEVVAGDEELGDGDQTPAALWISGPDDKAPSTEIFSFTIGSSEALHDHVGREIHRIVRHHLSRHTPLNPPPPADPGGDVQEALLAGVTRLSWMKFGQSLQTPP